MAAKRLPRLNGFRLLSVLIGVLLLVSISFYSANTDIATAEDALSTRVDYIKEQCADYSSLNLASEAKSLLRVTESAQQCARDIWYLSEKPDDLCPAAEDVLPHFVENHYLTGLLLLSRDGQITKSYCKEEALLPRLNKVLTTDSLLDVADHPKKTYAVRLVCGDDSFLDIAASAREGADCIVVAFYHTPAEYVHTYKLSYQHLVSGFHIATDGTLAVASGNEIIAANDESLLGLSTDEVAPLQLIKQRGVYDRMVYVRDTGMGTSGYFGYTEKGLDYYVYAFLPEAAVFTTTPKNIIFVVISYTLIILLIELVRRRTMHSYQEEKLLQEKAYQKSLEKAARKAEAANVAKTEFLQRMSHDIRTPINGIRGMVEIGDHYADDMTKQAECRRKIWDASGFLLELVNEVLDMGKLESGEVGRARTPAFQHGQAADRVAGCAGKAGRRARHPHTLRRHRPAPPRSHRQPDPRKAADDEHYE